MEQAWGDATIPINVKEPSNVARKNWPVTSGIPFPRGMLKDPSKVRLVHVIGEQPPLQMRELPLQTRALAHWLDGSIRWLLLDFQVDLEPGETFKGKLELGKEMAAVAKPIRTEQQEDGTLKVNTGAIIVSLLEV